MLTYSDDEPMVAGAIRAGAHGYLVHGRFEPDELTRAVRDLAAGKRIVSPSVRAGDLRSHRARGEPRARPAARVGPRRADRARARGDGLHRPRALQPRHRPGARDQREDGQEPHPRDLREARRGHPRRGDGGVAGNRARGAARDEMQRACGWLAVAGAGALALGRRAGGRRAGARAGEGQPALGGDRRRGHAARRLARSSTSRRRAPCTAASPPGGGRARRSRSPRTRRHAAPAAAPAGRRAHRGVPDARRHARPGHEHRRLGRRRHDAGRARRRWASACDGSATRSSRPTARSWTRCVDAATVLFQRVAAGRRRRAADRGAGPQPRRRACRA